MIFNEKKILFVYHHCYSLSNGHSFVSESNCLTFGVGCLYLFLKVEALAEIEIASKMLKDDISLMVILLCSTIVNHIFVNFLTSITNF